MGIVLRSAVGVLGGNCFRNNLRWLLGKFWKSLKVKSLNYCKGFWYKLDLPEKTIKKINIPNSNDGLSSKNDSWG
jgi:hypothetical protein